jgi:uncharacterized protein (TIRG00374 family)
VTTPEAPRLPYAKIRRAAAVFVLGSVAILAATLLLTTDETTWRGVVSFGAVLVVVLFLVQFLRMVLEALGLLVLLRASGEPGVSFMESLELTVEGYFVGQLIPLSAAGVPYQAFLLVRKGVRAGWASAAVLVKGFIPGLFFLVVLLVVAGLFALGWEGPPASRAFLKIVAPISAVPTAFVVALFVVMVRKPAIFDLLVDHVTRFLSKRFKGRGRERVMSVRDEIESESRIFREALTTLGRERRWTLAWGSFLVVLAYVAEFVVGLVIILGFGYRGDIAEPLVLQSILKPILTASPTPGSLAIGEGGYIGFFAVYLPESFVGVSLLLWRLVLYFVPMFVGGVMVARRVGFGRFARRPAATGAPLE